MSKRVDYQQFITILQKLVAKKATNNLVLLTEDKHSLWMGLTNGVITSIIFGPKRGKSSLPFITRIASGQLSLDIDTNLPPMLDLPSTEDILLQLLGNNTHAEFTADIDAAHLKRIIDDFRQLLKGYIGPIANTIMPGLLKEVDDISSEVALLALIDKMANEVEGIGDAEQFRQDAKKLANLQ